MPPPFHPCPEAALIDHLSAKPAAAAAPADAPSDATNTVATAAALTSSKRTRGADVGLAGSASGDLESSRNLQRRLTTVAARTTAATRSASRRGGKKGQSSMDEREKCVRRPLLLPALLPRRCFSCACPVLHGGDGVSLFCGVQTAALDRVVSPSRSGHGATATVCQCRDVVVCQRRWVGAATAQCLCVWWKWGYVPCMVFGCAAT